MNLIKLLALALLLYVGYRIVTMFQGRKPQDVKAQRADDAPKGEDLVQDPFCRTYIPKSQALAKEIDGQTHYFCSSECFEKYRIEKK